MADETTDAGAPLGSHLSGIVEKRLQKLEKCLSFGTAEDPVAAVHDLRVASRRLRAFGVVFREVLTAKVRVRLERRLKRVTKAAGALRDCDVQLGLVEGRMERAGSDVERACLEHLLEHFDAERSRAAREAQKRLRKIKVDALASLVLGAVQAVISRLSSADAQRAHALALLEHLVAEATEHTPPNDGAEHAEALHLLRIDLKQIRYALELFEPLLGTYYGALYERAIATQELLGTHHDLAVLGEIVEKRAAELEQKNRRVLSAGMQAVHEAVDAERREVAARFRSTGFASDWWREKLNGALASAHLVRGKDVRHLGSSDEIEKALGSADD